MLYFFFFLLYYYYFHVYWQKKTCFVPYLCCQFMFLKFCIWSASILKKLWTFLSTLTIFYFFFWSSLKTEDLSQSLLCVVTWHWHARCVCSVRLWELDCSVWNCLICFTGWYRKWTQSSKQAWKICIDGTHVLFSCCTLSFTLLVIFYICLGLEHILPAIISYQAESVLNVQNVALLCPMTFTKRGRH